MSALRKGISAAVGALLIVGVAAPMAQATRDRPPAAMSWEWQGGTPNAASSDGPKSSNSYNLANGAYVYRRGYWDIPLSSYNAGFTYQNTNSAVSNGDGSPRISAILSDTNKAETGDVIYLDPYHCPSAYNANGWAESNFFRTGSTCTIFGSWSNTGYTGTNAIPNVAPATSAWSKVIAAAQQRGNVYVSYGFLLNDAGPSVVVDRVRFGGDVVSLFPTNAAPDADNDGVIDRADNCPGVVTTNTNDVDGDDVGDACDTDLDVAGTYAGKSNDPGQNTFYGTIDQTDAEATDGSYDGNIAGGPGAPDCFSLSGSVPLTFGSETVTGTVDTANSSVCDPEHDDTYVLDLVLNIGGTVYGKTAGGTVHFVGTQGATQGDGHRDSTGTVTGTITAT